LTVGSSLFTIHGHNRRVNPPGARSTAFTPRETDDIANLCFIAGKTNRQISDKPPSEYFPSVLSDSGRAAFEAQCIPTDESVLRVECYRQFLQQRRELIAKRLNEFLGMA
jgi:hypothetical protein